MEQEECLLLPTEDLPLFRIDSERIKKDRSHWKQGHSDSLLLLTKQRENKLGEIFLILEEQMADISQVDMREITRRYGKEEVVRMMKEIVENNEKILKTQKQLGELQVEEKRRRQIEIRRREEERTRKQEEMDRWMEECRKRNEKEREEKEEKKRVEEEWRKIESMRKREERRAEKE